MLFPLLADLPHPSHLLIANLPDHLDPRFGRIDENRRRIKLALYIEALVEAQAEAQVKAQQLLKALFRSGCPLSPKRGPALAILG